MEKNKYIKICIIIAVICIILGSVFIGVGVVKGGDIHNFTVYKSWNWFPMFDYSEHSEEEQSINLNDTIKNMKVDVDIASIEITKGSSNILIIKDINKQYVKVNQERDAVSLHVKHAFMIGKSDNKKIIIQLKDNVYETMQISNDLGKIDIKDIRAKKFIVNANLGEVNMDDIYSEDLNIEQNLGDVKVKGILLGNSIVHNELGKIDVEINGKQQDYRYRVYTNLGNAKVQDMKKSGNGSIEKENDAKNYVRLSCSLGDVDLNFN